MLLKKYSYLFAAFLIVLILYTIFNHSTKEYLSSKQVDKLMKKNERNLQNVIKNEIRYFKKTGGKHTKNFQKKVFSLFKTLEKDSIKYNNKMPLYHTFFENVPINFTPK